MNSLFEDFATLKDEITDFVENDSLMDQDISYLVSLMKSTSESHRNVLNWRKSEYEKIDSSGSKCQLRKDLLEQSEIILQSCPDCVFATDQDLEDRLCD